MLNNLQSTTLRSIFFISSGYTKFNTCQLSSDNIKKITPPQFVLSFFRLHAVAYAIYWVIFFWRKSGDNQVGCIVKRAIATAYQITL